jgi:hypothetical protein
MAEKAFPPRRPWYKHQKQHWQGWLERKAEEGQTSAAVIYNRLLCAPMLISFAEVFGVPAATMRRAIVLARKCDDFQTSCAIIRRIIPWSLVEQQFEQ